MPSSAASAAPASAPADDYEFLRRVTLDVTGRLPKPDEIRAFVKSPDRDRKIDGLLASDEAEELLSLESQAQTPAA